MLQIFCNNMITNTRAGITTNWPIVCSDQNVTVHKTFSRHCPEMYILQLACIVNRVEGAYWRGSLLERGLI